MKQQYLESTKIAGFVNHVLEDRKALLESDYLHRKKIILTPDKGRHNDIYVVRVEGLYGTTLEAAEKANKPHAEWLTCVGYHRLSTLRHPIAGEWSVFCMKDDVARTESEEIARLIAYSLAREEGIMISERLGYPFEDRINKRS